MNMNTNKGVRRASLRFVKKKYPNICIVRKKIEYFNTWYFGPNKCENLPIKIISMIITSVKERPSISTFKFINNISASGIGVGYLKYRIVESKITLLIDALNALNK